MNNLWTKYFEPIVKLGWEEREGQAKLGNAIIKNLAYGGILVGQAECGTGKSLASLIPVIHKINEARRNGETYRAVVSTETLTLQRQLDLKDLPFLQKIYGGFTYKKLMGRSNYICFNHLKEEAIGNADMLPIYTKLDSKRFALTTGEKEDVDRILKFETTKDQWSRIAGNSKYCGENKCDDEECFGGRARTAALSADIVVANHSILAIDFDLKQGGRSEDGMLGPINAIIVDEAHKLEEVLSAQWEQKYTEWEITDHLNRLQKGIQLTSSIVKNLDYRDEFEDIYNTLIEFLDITKKFFAAIEDLRGKPWDGSENTFCMQFVTRPTPKIKDLMLKFEEYGPIIFKKILDNQKKYNTAFLKAYEVLKEQNGTKKDKKTIRQATSSIKFLDKMSYILNQAMNSKDGIVRTDGTVFGLTIEGWVRKNGGEQAMSIRAIPIDVSEKAAQLWKSVTSSVLISATLEDLSSPSKDFKYFKRSLGVQGGSEIRVESPFTMSRQQLVYVSNKASEPEPGTVFSVDEIVKSVDAAQGRSLILFTSRKDLDMTYQALLQMKGGGMFPYMMYVQTPDADKAKLVDNFKSNTFSVLLGLKSMFTGIDIPGESLSNVIICRFPLSRFSTECKMKIQYWRTQGFPNWYERDSLTVFQQAAGRLIRSEECIGVVSILDQRVSTVGTNVFKTASKGIAALGSRVTINIEDVERHLGALSEV